MAEFALVAALVVVLVAGVVQVALVLHVRNTLVDSAAEGARHAALLGSGHEEGVARTVELITAGLSPRYAEDVTARTTELGGVAVVRVEVCAPVPVVGLLGPAGRLEVGAHAVLEGGP